MNDVLSNSELQTLDVLVGGAINRLNQEIKEVIPELSQEDRPHFALFHYRQIRELKVLKAKIQKAWDPDELPF